MTDRSVDEIVRRAERAKLVFHDPAFVEAMAALDARYVDCWRQAQDAATREKCWARVAALKDVQDELERMIDDAIPATTASPRISRTISD